MEVTKSEIRLFQKNVSFLKDIKALEKIVDKMVTKKGMGVVKGVIGKLIKKFET